MTTTPTVAWIGLGAMGGPMALATAASGMNVTAYDVFPASLEAVAPHVAAAPTARAAVEGADVVAIMVATGPQLQSVLFGDDGIDLLMMVGGNQADVAAVQPLLDAMASNAPVVGPRPGDGQRFKIVNQLLCGVHIAAAGEALALADSMGLDLAQVHEVLGTGAAASFMFGDRGQRMVDGAFDDVRSALDIFVKDMGLVGEAARDVHQQVPLASTAEQLYVRGHREGVGRKDDSIVFKLLRGEA